MTLYNMLQINPKLFADIVVYEKIDKDVLLDQICLRCINLDVIADEPDIFKQFVDHFFLKNYDIYKKLYDTCLMEYEPLENVDVSINSKRVLDSDVVQDDASSSDSNSENTISAMNSSSYQPDNKNVSGSSAKYDGSTERDDTETYENRRHGKEGSESYQSLIQRQRELARYDFYNEFAEDFEHELCVSVY